MLDQLDTNTDNLSFKGRYSCFFVLLLCLWHLACKVILGLSTFNFLFNTSFRFRKHVCWTDLSCNTTEAGNCLTQIIFKQITIYWKERATDIAFQFCTWRGRLPKSKPTNCCFGTLLTSLPIYCLFSVCFE